MRRRTWCVTLLLGFGLTGCGPIIGQMMRAADGVKAFEVKHGTLEGLGRGKSALVLGPFAKTSEAFYIARGEDAVGFAEEFQRQGVLQATVRVEPMGTAVDPEQVRGLTPEQLRERYSLAEAPARVVFGTIMKRETVIAPTRGVVMIVAYRLEFFDPLSKASTVLMVAVRDLAERAIPLAVEEIRRQLDAAGD
ncbi:MAG: hypothetical protein P1P84_15670 [Deferrisomatales bacterium]|nr:hypothetical protein [Deferrisomatales bacterium]